MQPWPGRLRAWIWPLLASAPQRLIVETETQPRSVYTTLLKRLEQDVDVAAGQPATFVLHFDKHTVGGSAAA